MMWLMHKRKLEMKKTSLVIQFSPSPIPSMGLHIHLYIVYHTKSTIHVGKYTITMDGMSLVSSIFQARLAIRTSRFVHAQRHRNRVLLVGELPIAPQRCWGKMGH